MTLNQIVVGQKYRNESNSSIYLGVGEIIWGNFNNILGYKDKFLVIIEDSNSEYIGAKVQKNQTDDNKKFWKDFYKIK